MVTIPRKFAPRPAANAASVPPELAKPTDPMGAEPFFEVDRVPGVGVAQDAPVEVFETSTEAAGATLRRPSVDELEAILQKEDGPPVTIRPDGTVAIFELTQPAPAIVEEVDEHAHLPDHVRTEIAAGKKAVKTSESQSSVEQAAGRKAREHHEHLATIRKPNATPESKALPPNPNFKNVHDQKMSSAFKAGGQTPSNVK